MSYASYALRFAVGFDGMMMVLSGMSDMNQMKDNLSFMKDFQPLSLKEQEAVKQVTEIFSIRSTFRFHIKFLRLVNHLPVLLALFHFYIHSFRFAQAQNVMKTVFYPAFFLYNSFCRELGILQITGR